MEDNRKTRELYSQKFNIDQYIKQYYSSIDEEEVFFLKQLSKIEGGTFMYILTIPILISKLIKRKCSAKTQNCC